MVGLDGAALPLPRILWICADGQIGGFYFPQSC